MDTGSDKAKQLQALEQALAMMAENFPPMWWRMYRNLQTEGFDEKQAFSIILTIVNGVAGGKLSC